MATRNCEACNELQEYAPDFVQNGVTKNVCTSLKNDTGLGTNSNHTDCDDLQDATDCLIGGMEDEIEAYDVCDWKDYLKRLMPNLYNLFSAIICTICGLWTNIKRLDCLVAYAMEGASFSFDEYTTSSGSYIVAGKGVSFANVSSSGTANDIAITYVAGGMAYITGSCLFYNSDFTDSKAVANYDNSGVNPTTSASRKGNTRWDTQGTLGTGGELVYELRLKKSEYPQIARFWSGIASASAGGVFDGMFVYRDEGQYAPGQRGWCDYTNGNPEGENSDRGHLVPSGYMYLQMRLKNLTVFNGNGAQYTPVAIVPMRVNKSAVKC